MDFKVSKHNFWLLGFSFVIGVLAYGFALTNFSLSVDSESFIYDNYSLDLGRWGNNLLRYHIFRGHLPYFTILLGLILLSFTAVELSKLFRLNQKMSFLFCALFLTFPQMAYHMIFNMQADSIPLGFLAASIAMSLYVKSLDGIFSLRSIGFFVSAALLMMFSLACYQALIFMPVIIYLIRLLQETDLDDFNFRYVLKSGLHFAIFMIISSALYYLSVKLLCPPIEQSYLSSYTSGDASAEYKGFEVWFNNLKGKAYYGARLYAVVPVIILGLLVKYALMRKAFVYKLLILAFLLVLPFAIAFFISNNYYPPRLYVTSGIVFAFIIVSVVKDISVEKPMLLLSGALIFTNIYFISMLFYSSNKIYNYDQNMARKIDMTIHMKYPNFDPNVNYVYFYGGVPVQNYDRMKLPDSEIFGGSLFFWDGGSNDRIINFFKFTDIAYYRKIDKTEAYQKIKDSIAPMPVWPNPGAVKMVDDVMIVRLGREKGAKLDGIE